MATMTKINLPEHESIYRYDDGVCGFTTYAPSQADFKPHMWNSTGKQDMSYEQAMEAQTMKIDHEFTDIDADLYWEYLYKNDFKVQPK